MCHETFQFSVSVNVNKAVMTEKKKRKPKPVLPIAKPKAVTVPEVIGHSYHSLLPEKESR